MGPGPAEIGSAANSYEILAKLASGGMAEIFLARSASLGGVERYVVLKRIMRQRAADTQLVRMFLDEARLAAQLQHPNIAQVYDIGKLGDAYFFTMEYVHGETVRALLHRSHALRKPVPLGCVLTIAAGAAAGLDYAHTRLGRDGRPLGIVHRDVSPSNLMVSFDGGVKIVDFGVAKAADRMQETRSGTVKGKIAYLSPEQCRGVTVDRRADLFSFGIVLWEMLATERLYKRGSDFDNMTAIVNEVPPLPSTKRPEVSPELDAIVMKLLAKDPDQRFATAGEALEAIEQVAAQTGSVLSTAGLGRQMRELFGQRPEPWIELQAMEQQPEGVTVTGEPVIGSGIEPIGSGIELELAAVPSIGQPPVEMSGPISRPVERSGRVTEPPAVSTVPVSIAQPILGAMAIPPSGPTASSVNAPLLDYPRVDRRTARVTEPPAIAEPARRLRGLPFVIAGAIIVVFFIVLWAVTRGDGDATHGDGVTVTSTALPPHSLPAVAPDAAVAVITPDAAIIAAVVDAAVAVEPPADAPEVAAAPADAGVPRPKNPPPVVAPAVVVPAAHDHDHDTKPDVSKLFAASKYRDVVDACRTGGASDRGLCALAACHLRDDSLARRYARSLGGLSRANLVTACKKLGVELEPPQAATPDVKDPKDKDPTTPKVDCDANPLACQHP